MSLATVLCRVQLLDLRTVFLFCCLLADREADRQDPARRN